MRTTTSWSRIPADAPGRAGVFTRKRPLRGALAELANLRHMDALRSDPQRSARDLGPHHVRVVRRDPLAEPRRAGFGGSADALPSGVPVIAAGRAPGHDVDRGRARPAAFELAAQVPQLVGGQRFLA